MQWFDCQSPSNSQYLRNCSARQIYACSTEAETNQKAVQHCEKMPRSSVGLDPNRYSNRYPFGPLAVHPLMQRVSGRPPGLAAGVCSLLFHLSTVQQRLPLVGPNTIQVTDCLNRDHTDTGAAPSIHHVMGPRQHTLPHTVHLYMYRA